MILDISEKLKNINMTPLSFLCSSGIENMVSSGIVAKGRFFITAEKSTSWPFCYVLPFWP